MEMNDNHVEYHTVKEFLTFCVGGPDAAGAGTWASTFPGKYLEGGKEAGGQLVDQRLLPRIEEGEVRVLMVGDSVQLIMRQRPEQGGLSAVAHHQREYDYYAPGSAQFARLEANLASDLPQLQAVATAAFVVAQALTSGTQGRSHELRAALHTPEGPLSHRPC